MAKTIPSVTAPTPTDTQAMVEGDALSKMRLRLWLAMLGSTRHIEAQLRDRLKVGFNSTLPRFDVLAALYRHEDGITMTQLSKQLLVSNGNVTGIVDRLEEEGLVERYVDERDRRATLVGLTEDGSDFFQAMAILHQEWIDELLGSLDAADIKAMTETLQGLRERQAEALEARSKPKAKGKR